MKVNAALIFAEVPQLDSGPRKQNQAQGGDGGGSQDGVLDHGHGQGEYIMMEELLRIVNYDTMLRWR